MFVQVHASVRACANVSVCTLVHPYGLNKLSSVCFAHNICT